VTNLATTRPTLRAPSGVRWLRALAVCAGLVIVATGCGGGSSTARDGAIAGAAGTDAGADAGAGAGGRAGQTGGTPGTSGASGVGGTAGAGSGGAGGAVTDAGAAADAGGGTGGLGVAGTGEAGAPQTGVAGPGGAAAMSGEGGVGGANETGGGVGTGGTPGAGGWPDGGIAGAGGTGGAAGAGGMGGAAGVGGVGGAAGGGVGGSAGGAAGSSAGGGVGGSAGGGVGGSAGGAAGGSAGGGVGGAAGAGGMGGGVGGAAGAGGGLQAMAFQTHSSSIATDPAGMRLYVVNPDADSVSILDRASHEILHEVLLAPTAPTVDGNGRYEPAVSPRALALSSAGTTLYVTGQRSGLLYAVDAMTGTVTASTAVCSEPVGVVVRGDDAEVFVACAQDDEIVAVRASDLTVIATAPCPRKPWALAWAPDGQTLLASHLLGPGVSVFTAWPLTFRTTWAVPDGLPGDDPRMPHGVVRGLYDVLARPGTHEVWVLHMMLGTDTAQPALDFRNTVFPTVTVLNADTGAQIARMSVEAEPGDGNAFPDVVSGPHALAFSPDGALAFVVDTNSEDVLVVDAAARVELGLLRPLPGQLPEGIVWAGNEIYIQERNSADVVAFTVDRTAGLVVQPHGAPFLTVAADPMPATLRLGQLLFHSANNDEYPITQNHWVACSNCHLEGGSDAVTWNFAQGPRDTPSNAGGTLDTGFQFRTADRNRVQDYWHTINVEQGGMFNDTDPMLVMLLDALAAYVNRAIPVPVPPSTDAAHTLRGQALADLRAQGAAVFESLGCSDCHSGPAFTDSGADNPTLELGGPIVSHATPGGVLLHDVGTCVTSGPFPDVAHTDVYGHPRGACAFDTPALRGLTDSAPYLHDGSAATLEAVLPVMLRAAAAAPLSSSDERALLEFLRGL
jgi:YVTN family beta-propeller protein